MGCFKLLTRAALTAAVFTGISFAVTVNNPIMYVDSPDPSIVRVDDAYYMVTTTMHFAPGVPKDAVLLEHRLRALGLRASVTTRDSSTC